MLKTLVANRLAGWEILVAIEPCSVVDEIASVAAKLLNSKNRRSEQFCAEAEQTHRTETGISSCKVANRSR
jgi:hypothetical protein